MKACPYCSEQIQDEAIKCRYCGEFLEAEDGKGRAEDDEAPPRPEGSLESDRDSWAAYAEKFRSLTFEEQHEAWAKLSDDAKAYIGKEFGIQPPGSDDPVEQPRSSTSFTQGGLGCLSLFGFLMIWAALSTSVGGLYLSFFLFFTCIAGGIYILAKTPRRGWGVFLTASGVLFALGSIGALETAEEKARIAEENRQAEADRQARAAVRRSRLMEEKEGNYSKGVARLKAGNFDEAISAFGLVLEVDSEFKDAEVLRDQARTRLDEERRVQREREERAAAERGRQEAATLVTDARKLLHSNNCGELSSGARKLQRAQQLAPSQATARLLTRFREEQLACYAGNSDIQMAIQIQERRPVTLYVSVKNISSRSRHANPNHFTLVTRSGQSLPYSSASFRYSKPFPAVDLQPGTVAQGILVFDTNAAPAKLVYKELIGTEVSREFP